VIVKCASSSSYYSSSSALASDASLVLQCFLSSTDRSAFHVILTKGDSVVSSFFKREVGNALRHV
jgi:hypothetical protein